MHEAVDEASRGLGVREQMESVEFSLVLRETLVHVL
jgi:hypothetical protein